MGPEIFWIIILPCFTVFLSILNICVVCKGENTPQPFILFTTLLNMCFNVLLSTYIMRDLLDTNYISLIKN